MWTTQECTAGCGLTRVAFFRLFLELRFVDFKFFDDETIDLETPIS